MKTIITLILGMLCCTCSLNAQIIIGNDKDVAFLNNMRSIAQWSAQIDPDLLKAIHNVLEDITDGQKIGSLHGGRLSEMLIMQNSILTLAGKQSDPIASAARDIIEYLNVHLTQDIKPIFITRGELDKAIENVKSMNDYLNILFDPVNQDKKGFPLATFDLRKASMIMKTCFCGVDPGLLLSTEDIRQLQQVSIIAEDWNFKGAGHAFRIAAAHACQKLFVIEEPTLFPSALSQ